jgi:hypothetical protein
VAVYGLLRDRSPATITNASFAFVHMAVLTAGIRFALRRPAVATPPAARRRPVRVPAR